MLTAVRTALLATLLAAFPFRQEAPDPFLLERVLPPDPLFYLSVPQSPRVSRGYRASNLRRFMEHEEVKAFVEPLETWWKKRRSDRGPRGEPSWNDMVKEMVGLTIDELLGLIDGPIGLAVYDIPLHEDRDLDVVLSLGAENPGEFRGAASKIIETLKRGGGDLDQSVFKHRGTTVHHLAVEGIPVYYAIVKKTAVVATLEERIKGIIEAAGDPAFAGLRRDPKFKAARSQVAPDDAHFFLAYLDVSTVLKEFRREIGDQALRVLETLGVTDITSLAAGLSYERGPIRERYAIMTARQDRGLLKFLSGGTPKDAAAAHVPAGALSYSHFGIDLAEAYDVFLEAAKISAEFEAQVRDTLRAYEERVGVKLRDAFAAVGNSWTSYSVLPENGGAFPDSVTVASLKDRAAFEAALKKITGDARIPIEEISFRGRTIRSIYLDPLALAGGPGPGFPPGRGFPPGMPPAPGPMMMPGMLGFMAVGVPIVFHLEGDLLFVSDNPLALKRQILRLERKPRPIAEDASVAAFLNRVPPDRRESWTYTDFGRAFNIVYSTLEPFVHYFRDFARDPETGELIVDLALLPMGETLADLIGASFTHKRTTRNAIVVDGWSNTFVASPSGVFTVAAIAAGAAVVAVAMLSRGRAAGGGGLATNERIAELSLTLVRQAEQTFRNSDSDGNGVGDYWTRDLAGLFGLKNASGQPIFLLDPATASADPDGAARYGLPKRAKMGYWFRMMITDGEGNAYALDGDKDGKAYTNPKRFGIVAYPETYGATGRFTFIVSDDGKIYKKDTFGQPVTRWPGKDPAAQGWMPTD